MAPALEFANVSKRYWIAQQAGGGVLSRLVQRVRPHREAFWAVRDVSFDVASGESLAIIGPNGAGKSTVLKLVSAITAPTRGEIRIHGRLAALLEIGSGFHPELTGRDNVFLSGAILGMRRAEIAAKFDRIVDFAGVGPFIDAPVKFYSSGMYVRLGFAVAAHVDAQVLLVDEVLAVGDESFQQRCYTRIDELRRAGTSIIFISHDLPTVERLCRRALMMAHGRVVADGPAAAVVTDYRRSACLPSPVPRGRSGVRALDIRVAQAPDAVATGHPLRVTVTWSAERDAPGAVVEVSYTTHGGAVLYCQQTTALSGRPLMLTRGTGAIEFETADLGLQPGCYDVTCRIADADGTTLDVMDARERLVVHPGRLVAGYFYMPHAWRHVPPPSGEEAAEPDAELSVSAGGAARRPRTG